MTGRARIISCNPQQIVRRIGDSLARQGFANAFGIQVSAAKLGFVEVIIPYSEELSDGNGGFHTGMIGALADIVGSYAGFTVMPENDSALSFEYKLNVLGPAIGDKIIGRGILVKEGAQTMFSKADIYCSRGGDEILCATGSVSIFILRDSPEKTRGGCVPD
ncbi:MAG: PaaI family thioesterase [Fimbriimonadaceae bacterium]|nr:PaaI family thioesterase [Alphaproteobacteria bacterium]